MASREQQLSYEQAVAASARASNALHEVLDQHEELCGRDALWWFLKIHAGISRRVLSNTNSPDLLHLNQLFAEVMVKLCTAFNEGQFSPDIVSPGWCKIYLQYQEEPFAVARLIPLMAAEHILGDLESVLFFVEVSKSEYDTVLDWIMESMDETRRECFRNHRWQNRLVEILEHTLGRGVIKGWRELAWQSLQRRKRCGAIAEAQKRAANLANWCLSGAPRQWMEDRGGQWNHDDWLGLLDQLSASEFWPMNPDEVGAVLERLKREYRMGF
jgi:hypothetical protein